MTNPEATVRRGEIYRVARPGGGDPRRSRPYVVVSRPGLLQANFSSVICAPVYSRHDELDTQVLVGAEAGLKQASSVHCDGLVSLPKVALTDYVGALSGDKLAELDRALAVALGIDHLFDSAR